MDAQSLPTVVNADTVLALVEDLADLPYGLEPVSQRAHALQCARLAMEDHADPELVAAALLHDIGRHPSVLAAYPDLDHEDAARGFLALHFGHRVAWLAWAHVPAKLHLADTEPGYAAGFSAGSVASLPGQRAAVGESVLAEFARHPWREDALRLRRWDDSAKVLEGPEPDRSVLHGIVEAALATKSADPGDTV